MRWAYIGNFAPAHSTENEIARALEANGHDVTRLQENDEQTWRDLTSASLPGSPEVLMWTRTGWDWKVIAGWSHDEALAVQQAALDNVRRLGVATVGYHLDRWWGLDREGQVAEPFFHVDMLCTADGGHDPEWAAAGVNHRWFPPAVSHLECDGGEHRREVASPVVFVGSWRPGYHREWTHRPELIDFLRRHFRGRVRFWPAKGRPAVRGQALRDLYASVRVVVGDSCLVPNADGSPCARYWSDRVPETVGRGAFLLHPWVEGIDEHFKDGEHLRLWPLGDWSELGSLIEHYLAHDDERRRIAEEGRRHVRENHTYAVRMRQLTDALVTEGLL